MSRLATLFVTLSVLIFAAPRIVSADPAVPPTVHLESYTGKPTHSFGYSGSGFSPGEAVDIYLGDRTDRPLATVSADPRGDLAQQNLTIPTITPGDYQLAFIGRTSQTSATVGFNVQGFHPWVVLDNYYIAPQAPVGFRGEDFVPGEPVDVYLNTRLSQPVATVTADASGHFDTNNGFSLPNLTGGNQLIFVGQQSQTEATASFAAATQTPTNPD
jgi:hypothetical protein